MVKLEAGIEAHECKPHCGDDVGREFVCEMGWTRLATTFFAISLFYSYRTKPPGPAVYEIDNRFRDDCILGEDVVTSENWYANLTALPRYIGHVQISPNWWDQHYA